MGFLPDEAWLVRIWHYLRPLLPSLDTIQYFTRTALARHKSKERLLQRVAQAQLQAEREAEEARKRYDPQGAIEDMRLAHSYLQDWEKEKNVDKLDVLAFAAKYIAKARQKDPNAKLIVETQEGEDVLSLDDLSGRTLFYEGQHYATFRDDKNKLTKAVDILRTAIAYKPYSIQFRQHLADVYLNLHDKKNALLVARDALEASPTDLEARKLFDRIEAAPVTRPPPRFQGIDAGCVLPLIMLALVGFMIYNLFQGEFSAAFTLLVIALILGGILRFIERDRMFRKALEHERDEAQRKRRGL
jgi:hypothetical protein